MQIQNKIIANIADFKGNLENNKKTDKLIYDLNISVDQHIADFVSNVGKTYKLHYKSFVKSTESSPVKPKV